MIRPRLLILPDIHGRRFHCEALKEAIACGADIICLGDYLDPYWGDELHEDGVFAPLKELVELKKAYPEHIHLLIGNHDSSYIYKSDMCECRYDYKNAAFYRSFFRENGDLFELAYLTEIAGKRFLFSHAGITRRWLTSNEGFFGKEIDNPENVLARLNKGYKNFAGDQTKESVWYPLSNIGRARGGWNISGSIIWADICEHMTEGAAPWEDVIQIFGHTQLKLHPARIAERAYCLDCRQPFYIDEEGILRSYYWNDKPIEATDLLELYGRR